MRPAEDYSRFADLTQHKIMEVTGLSSIEADMLRRGKKLCLEDKHVAALEEAQREVSGEGEEVAEEATDSGEAAEEG